MKMNAAIYYGPGDIRVEKVERPNASDGFEGMGMVVKIKACGICDNQDVPRYEQWVGDCGTGIALGHEWTGEVVEIGPKVTDVKVGDRVWGRSFVPCGKCDECLAKNYVKCKNFIMGMTGRYLNGAFAEYMLFPFVIDNPSILVKLPADVSYRDGALIEPTRLCLGVAEKAKVSDVVVVLGQGFRGLGTLARLKTMGVAKVIVSDVSKKRLEKSRKLGADVIVDELNEDIVKIVMRETSGAGTGVVMDSAEDTAGVGADVVIETDGRPANFQRAIDMIRRHGTFWIAAPYKEGFMFNPSLHRPEMPGSNLYGKSGMSIRNPWGTLGDGPLHVRAMEFIRSGAITADKVVSHVFPLSNIKEAFETAMNSPDMTKVIVEP